MIYKTTSAKETQKVAALLAKKILSAKYESPRKGAVVLALKGNLGGGKTTFVQGFLKAVGVKKRVMSPTFVILKRFGIYNSRFKNAYHVDCYRLKKPVEFRILGLAEILKNPENIVLIEWAGNIKKILPNNVIRIKFNHSKKENERIINIK